MAADYGNLSMVKKLVEKGANANAKNRYGNTPMYFNASYGYAEIVERFVEKEANTNAKNKDGITPLDIARDRKHNNIVKYLEEKLNRERESVQHKHRHHHGEYDRRHPSHEPLFVDSGNQPEVTVRENVSKNLLQNDEVDYNKGRATSGASKPSFWIDAVKSVSQFISFSFKPTIGVEHSQPSKAITTVQGIDMNGTLFSLDVFTKKIIGQKYIFTVDQSMFPLEAQGYALNIIENFEKSVEVLNKLCQAAFLVQLNFQSVGKENVKLRHS